MGVGREREGVDGVWLLGAGPSRRETCRWVGDNGVVIACASLNSFGVRSIRLYVLIGLRDGGRWCWISLLLGNGNLRVHIQTRKRRRQATEGAGENVGLRCSYKTRISRR